MKKYFKIGFGLMAMFLSTSCQKEVKLKDNETANLLVLNCILNPDSNMCISLTKSRSFASAQNEFEAINNAQIFIYEQNILISTLTNGNGGNYRNNYKPLVGKTYTIKTEAIGFKASEATVSILNFPIIDSLKILKNAISSLSSSTNTQLYFDKYYFNLYDLYGADNYYEIILKYENKTEYTIESDGSFSSIATDEALKVREGTILLIDNDLKENFKKEADRKDNYYTNDLFFSNKNFKAQTKSLSVYVEQTYTNTSKNVYLIVSKISKEYYNYLVTLNKQQNAVGAYAEAVRVNSNIKNGLGILGSMSSVKIKLK